MAFGRFFSPSNFAEFGNVDEAERIAKKADEVLTKYCYLVYGTFNSKNEAVDFTTVKKSPDTHAALLLAPKVMAAFEPENIEIKKDEYEKSDLLQSQTLLIKQLQAELKSLRRGPNE